MNYTTIIPVLTEAIKEQQKMIEQQTINYELLKSKLDILEIDLDKSCTKNNAFILEYNTAKLYQNNPNPFSGITEISFHLPNSVKIAFIT